MEPFEIIILGLIGFGLFMEHIILLWCRSGVIRVIKQRFIKHGVNVLKVFNTGAIQQSYSKPKEKYTFGKGDHETSTYDTGRHHFDAETGLPWVIIVEGNPANADLKTGTKNLKAININKEYPPQKHSAIINQLVVRAENYGVIKTLTRIQDALKQNKIMLILLIILLIVSAVSAASSFLALQAITGG